MTDLATLFDTRQFVGDLALDDRLLRDDDSIETAVVISLFTDRRAEPDDELPAGETDRRGWWGDALAQNEGDRIGSRLWLLKREKQTTETLNRAREYAREALAWLIEDGVASRVEVAAEWVRTGLLGMTIEIALNEGTEFRQRFETALGGT